MELLWKIFKICCVVVCGCVVQCNNNKAGKCLIQLFFFNYYYAFLLYCTLGTEMSEDGGTGPAPTPQTEISYFFPPIGQLYMIISFIYFFLLWFILRKHTDLNLPKYCRTLLKTPRKSSVVALAGNSYCHFHLKRALSHICEKREIKAINISSIE